MSFSFRPAVRENVGLLIGLAGGTGSGKTFSALELASGIADGRPFAVIDTEARRALHYADRYKFDHGDLRPPFRPQAYVDAIAAADAAGYPVIVVDSASHEWAGEGGLLDWHDEELSAIVERKREFAEGKGWQFDEHRTREANTFSAWIAPKMAHKAYVQKLLQVRAHLILCFRAEEKIEIVKVNDAGEVVEKGGRTVVRAKDSPTGRDGWVPVCERNMPYELTCSFLLMADRPGYGLPIKLQAQHRALFPLDKPIGRASGEAIAQWAAGSEAKPAATGPSDLLTQVLAGIETAQTRAELESVIPHAKGLAGPERARAQAAYKAKLAKVAP